MDPNYSQDAASIGSDTAMGASVGGPWGAVAGAAVGVGTSIYGYYQQQKAAELAANAKTNTGPNYTIPPEIQENLTQAQQQALEGLPDEQKQQYINNLQRSTSFGLGAMNDRRAGLTGLGGIVGAQDQGYQNLLASDSAARKANLATLMGARSDMANYSNAQFTTNQLNPFLRNDAYAKAMQGAAIQNTMGGFNTIAHAIGAYRQPNGQNSNNPRTLNGQMDSSDYGMGGGGGSPSGPYNPFAGAPDQIPIQSANNVMQPFDPGLGLSSGGMNNWLGM